MDTLSDQSKGTGYLGFIITYSDGHIENRLMDYNRENHDLVRDKIRWMHDKTLRQHDPHK